jgi:aminoglycoside phosphotransferase (APT) family kinase protein
VEPVVPGGSDNATYRLGSGLSVRLPRGPTRGVGQIDRDRRWLPLLAPHLPLAVPEPVAKGAPGEGYPFEWAVYRWLPGELATPERLGDPADAAMDLARFLAALQSIDATAGPRAGPPNASRGIPLRLRDDLVRTAIADLKDEVDTAGVTAAWESALTAEEWQGPGVWIHGDLLPENLLVVDGRLSAVLDFSLCVGDPATDVMVAWTVLPAAARPLFRSRLGVDDATWARARGWALSVALIQLPYYRETHLPRTRNAHRTIAEVLADSD